MKKELFEMTCTFDFEKYGGLNIRFEIKGNEIAKKLFGEKEYHEYLERAADILKPATEELNDLSSAMIGNDIKKHLEEPSEFMKMIFEAFKEYMEGEK